MNATKQYKCTRCGAIYNEKSDAEVCCSDSVDKVYVCDECGDDFENENDAEACCTDEE